MSSLRSIMKDEYYFVGIDAGTSYTKAVLINIKMELLSFFVRRTGISIEASSSAAFKAILSSASLSKIDINHITATGYGKSKVDFANTYKTEISCHAKGAYHYFPKEITIIDIGGQDTKVIKLDNKGKIIR
ncbi:MAG: BadF/BadG/BcrA/BcrD ATPase family protein, partial [Promethearchaeota archaeon]